MWAAKGPTKAVVGEFFDALGLEQSAALQFVTCDGAEWIRTRGGRAGQPDREAR